MWAGLWIAGLCGCVVSRGTLCVVSGVCSCAVVCQVSDVCAVSGFG